MKNRFKKHFLKKSFTLVEMLTVMAVIGILLGIGLPAFEKIVKGHGVEAAARGLGAKISYARSAAVTNNMRAAIILPDASSTLGGDFNNSQARLCLVSLSGTTYKFVKWLDNDRWYKLPTGTMFNDVASPFNITAVNCTDIGAAASITLPGIVFSSSGAVDGNPTTAYVVAVKELGATNTTNKIEMTINSFTGKTSYTGEL